MTKTRSIILTAAILCGITVLPATANAAIPMNALKGVDTALKALEPVMEAGDDCGASWWDGRCD